jgi:hypothetical protein
MSPLTNRQPDDESELSLSVQDRSENSGREAQEGGGGPLFGNTRSVTGASSRRAALIHQLAIDWKKGTYALRLDGKTSQLEITETSGGTGQEDKTTVRDDAIVGAAIDLIGERPLPKDGNVIAGSEVIPKNRLTKVSFVEHGPVRGTIAWTLSPTPLEDVELVLKPEGYDEWLPRGGRDEETEGNFIRLNAVLRKRGGGATALKMKDAVVRLDEVSREPGVCLNLPVGKGTNASRGATSPDLKFAADRNPGTTIDEEGTRLRKKGGEFPELPIVVSSYDWGAYGAVHVQATLTDGRPVWAHLDGDPTHEPVRLPKRDPELKTADKWKADVGVDPTTEDEADRDKQKGNDKDGDGLTLYEEYRGLIAKGEHTRDHPAGPDGHKPLTPGVKDLIVHNTMEDGGAGAPTAAQLADVRLLEKASGIHVVDVAAAESPESRQVNLNTGRITAGPQFGLRLSNEAPAGGGGAVGVTVGVRGPNRLDPKPSSPKGFTKVTVSLDGLKAEHEAFAAVCKAEGRKVPSTLSDSITVTVTHELAHGLGVPHHGPQTHGSPYPEVTVKMVSYKVLDRDGKPIPDRPFAITGGVGAAGNESSGDVGCVMCYNNVYNWVYHDPARTFYAVPFIPNGHAFCTSSKPTGPNAAKAANGTATPTLFGAATAGNCLGRMRVKDQGG